jgi:cellobiose phosphorylase
MMQKYGYFNKIGNEYIITNPETPRAFDNFLWNDAAFSNVQQTGVGYFDYQVGKTEGVQLLTGVGRICDFDVFGRDHLMNRLIYIRDNATGEYWNVNWEPVRKAYESYECVHGLGYTEIKSRTSGIASDFKIFIPAGSDPVELWQLKTVNGSGKKKSLSIFVYNQFQFKYKWGFDSYGDMIYRTNWLNKELNAVVAIKHPFRKPHEYLTGFVTSDEAIKAFDGNRESFVGVYNTLAAPQAVIRGNCSNTPGSADATAIALQYDLELEDKQEKVISLILGATDKEENIKGIREKYLGQFDHFLNEVKVEKERLTENSFIKTPDEHMDRLLNYWVKQAAQYGATWCRWGWNGYRDIVQHGLGVSMQNPQRTKNILLEALSYQYSNGLAVRGWNPVDEKPYSDSALWLVFTLAAYLKETGDIKLLDEAVPFYDKGSDTVRRHIDIALNFLENNKGSHDLILIKFGDWNDSLTGVGKEGRGESVWLSLAYAEAMREMAELSGFLAEREKEKDYLERRERIMEAINKNAWDGKWYTRCFDDSGRPIGSNSNEYAKIFMEPQCWALISGTANSERARDLLDSCDKILGTDLGYLLLAPPFTKIDDNIGRISSMEPGIAENGTVYSHLNIWMILGLLRYGMADKAYALFRKITPGYIEDEKSPKNNCPPFMYSNCYFGPDHKNNKFQMEFTWITGSVAWFNNVLLKEMLGAKANYRGLEIDPCIPSEWDSCEVQRYFRGSCYHITIKNQEHVQKGRIELKVDGVKFDGNLIPAFADGKDHKVNVVIRKA